MELKYIYYIYHPLNLCKFCGSKKSLIHFFLFLFYYFIFSDCAS